MQICPSLSFSSSVGVEGEGVIHDVQLEKNLHKNNQDVFYLTDTSKVQ